MSGSRHSQIESHHALPAPGLHTNERRRVPFPHIAGAARFPSTELSEQSSSWGSYAEEAIFHRASEKVPLLARPINLLTIGPDTGPEMVWSDGTQATRAAPGAPTAVGR